MNSHPNPTATAPTGADSPPIDVGTVLADALTDVQIDQCAADVAHVMPRPGQYLMSVPMLREVIRKAVSVVATLVPDALEAADGAEEPERDDGPRDSTRLNWLEAQAQISIYEWYPAEPGAVPFFELNGLDGDTMGTGPDLRAAIDDAMGRAG